MAKNIIKEVVIVVLILLAIVLLLGILLYDYIPLNKTIPIKVEAYEISNELEQELGKEVLEDSEDIITKTYTVDESDLQLYEKTEDYDKGKKNPFSTIEEGDIDLPIENEINDDNDDEPNINTTK